MEWRNLVATTILLVLDFIWIALYMGKQYREMIPTIQHKELNPKFGYAIIAYSLMVLGLNLFVLPNVRKGYELEDSLKYGFTFGIIVYGIFDFTNAAVLDNWDIRLALIDVLWGGLVYFVASYLATKLMR